MYGWCIIIFNHHIQDLQGMCWIHRHTQTCAERETGLKKEPVDIMLGGGLYVVGCVKCCGDYINTIFQTHLKALLDNITDGVEIVIAYDHNGNNPGDGSLEILIKLQEDFPLTILYANGSMTKRTLNIANARNRIVDYISNNPRYEHTLMMDFDDVNAYGTLNLNLLDSVQFQEWDVLTFNRKPYYDIWALKIDEFQVSCWHFDQPKIVEHKMQEYVTDKLKKTLAHSFLICDSAFNGFALIKTSKLTRGKYNGEYNISNLTEKQQITNEKATGCRILKFDIITEDCEHKSFCCGNPPLTCRISPFSVFNDDMRVGRYIHSKFFRTLAHHILSPNTSDCGKIVEIDYSTLKEKDVVYVCTAGIPEFLKQIHKVQVPIILISNDSDLSFPNGIIDEAEFLTTIQNPNITKWFVQNSVCRHPKIHQIPIGLDLHTMETKNTWGHITKSKHQDENIDMIACHSAKLADRKIKCYCNFQFRVNTTNGHDRLSALNEISNTLLFLEPKFTPRFQSHINQSQYAFVISPLGNGLDCHRTWEALILGCVPILRKSDLCTDLFDDLPVLMVEEWKDVTIDLLHQFVQSFDCKAYNFDKLHCSYWCGVVNDTSPLGVGI